MTLGGFAVAAATGVLFVWYELRTSQPMLDIRLFRNARLSAGAGAVGIVFMAMLGTLFLITQYLQFVRGYSPLDTGLRLVPLALGFMIGAPLSAALVAKLGSKKVISSGMFVVAVAIGSMAIFDLTTSYWVIGLLLLVTGIGMANAMAPATDAVMAAVPEAQAGVASALNDTTRQVGGALGVAVYGSILNSVYASRLTGVVGGLSAEASDAASNSIGGALQIASGEGGAVAADLVVAAGSAFVDAQSVVYVVTGAVALAGAVLIARFMPAHDLVLGAPSEEHTQGEVAGLPVAIATRIDD